MGEVVQLDVITKGEVPPQKVVDGIDCENIEHLIVVAFDKNGELEISMSSGEIPINLWMLELAKKRILEASEE
jgi:hypothetical protein